MAKKAKKKAKAKRGGAKRSSGARRSGSTAMVSVSRGKKPGKKPKRKLPAALKRPVQPDKKLASIIGSKKLPRPQVVKKLWDYFRRHKLNSGRTIRLDSKLKSSGIWGKVSKIDMLKVGKALKHAK